MSPTEFMRTYEAAANMHNLDKTLELIADDAIYLFSDQSAHIGKRAIREAIESNFNAIKDEKYNIENLVWLAASKDVAACVYEFNWSGEIEGQFASGGGRGTTVLRHVEGNWRIAHEHLSRGRIS